MKISDELRIKLAITILPWWLRQPIASLMLESDLWDRVKRQRVATWRDIRDMWKIRPTP